jgi:hypothetical protein
MLLETKNQDVGGGFSETVACSLVSVFVARPAVANEALSE